MSFQEDENILLNIDYIIELKTKFPNLIFHRIENICGLFITNPVNTSFANDSRIFIETVAKIFFRQTVWPWTTETSRRKLQYFSMGEHNNDIYKLDHADVLQPNEKYAIQNVGHATQLISLPSCTILTDPIFGDMFWIVYTERTESHPKICDLPKIDVVIISHNHRDHTDEESLRKIIALHNGKGWDVPKVFVPMGDKDLFESFGFKQVIEVEWFSKISVVKANNNVTDFICIPADHRSGRGYSDHHKSHVNGWVISDDEGDVIFKFSGDTRSLTDQNQEAVDAVIWNEIMNKEVNRGKKNKDVFIPDVVCFEPSGPNYTRCDMDVTHQSGSYSALLKFVQAQNIAKLSDMNVMEVLEKIQTVMMHQNKFELGPDRFNEGVFVVKKLIVYLGMNHEELIQELTKEELKLKLDVDKYATKKLIMLMFRPLIAWLPAQTSMVVHAKDFIIKEIFEVTQKLQAFDGEKINDILIKYLISNTKFLKIGERMNRQQLKALRFDINLVDKYNKKEHFCIQNFKPMIYDMKP